MTTATMDRILRILVSRTEPPENCLICSDCRMLFTPDMDLEEPVRSRHLGHVLNRHRREECGARAGEEALR